MHGHSAAGQAARSLGWLALMLFLTVLTLAPIALAAAGGAASVGESLDLSQSAWVTATIIAATACAATGSTAAMTIAMSESRGAAIAVSLVLMTGVVIVGSAAGFLIGVGIGALAG